MGGDYTYFAPILPSSFLMTRKLLKMVRPEGVEPPTYWFVASCSIQLSYGRTLRGMQPSKNTGIRRAEQTSAHRPDANEKSSAPGRPTAKEPSHPCRQAHRHPQPGWRDFRHTNRAMMREFEIPIQLQRTLMRMRTSRPPSPASPGAGGTVGEHAGCRNAKEASMVA